MLRLLSLWCLLFSVSGCVRFVAPPPFDSGQAFPQRAWDRVLARFVDDDGRIDFASLAHEPRELETYVAYIARVSPRSRPALFSRAEDKIAYYINSYNALAMYGVLAHGIPHGFHTGFDRLRFFKLTEFHIGGRATSLYDYENDVIRKAGDPRVHFALNCMSVGCPRLPRLPFQGQELDLQLDTAAREFLNSAKHVQVEEDRRVVRLSEIFDFYREDFVKEDTLSPLIRYVNKYREQKLDPTFRVEFIPYDWTVNRQPVAFGSSHASPGGLRLATQNES